MAQLFSRLTRDQRRRIGKFAGAAGIASLLAVGLPLWAGAAPFGPLDVEWGPKFSVKPAGEGIGFGIEGCVDTILEESEVLIEIDTDLDDSKFGVFPDVASYAFDPDELYVYSTPPEWDFLEGDADAGPEYDVYVACFVPDGPDEGDVPDGTVQLVGEFTYVRGTSSTSSSSSSTTSTTAGGGTTTSTTTPASTTSTTAPGSTTSTTTGGGTTTSTTVGGTTTTTTAATTTSTTGATTSTTAGATTTTAGTGTTTTTTAAATTTTAGTGTTTTTVAGGTTSTTSPAGTTTSTAGGGGTTSSSSSSSSTSSSLVSAACTVSDSTPTNGQSVTVTCPGFAPNSPVQLDILSTPVSLGTLTANAQGVVSGAVLIPLNTTAGTHQIRLTGTAPGGASLVKSIPITVEKQLPRTGSDSWTQLRISLLLVGVGLLMLGRSQLVSLRA